MISVCIPVGPAPHYKEFLGECLESIRSQSVQPSDIVLVDDMAGLTPQDLFPLKQEGDVFSARIDGIVLIRDGNTVARIWRAPWRLGVPAVANVAYALAQSDLAFQLSCDDRLMPTCLERCQEAWDKHRDPLGFYWVDILYSTGEGQSLPCGHAMVHKDLWRYTGGYPPEAGVGACDHIFINMLMEHPEAGHLIHVEGGQLYWHREHDLQYTKHQNAHPGSIADVRTVFSQRWTPQENKWGRYEP